ncbi:MAG: ABC transporter substrate-binding protein [Roseiflexaceae bacterium]
MSNQNGVTVNESEQQQRRQFLRRCVLFGAGFVVSACNQRTPDAPAVQPTIEISAEVIASMAPTPTVVVTPTLQPTSATLNLPVAPSPGPLNLESIGGMNELVVQAESEGELTIIGMPRELFGYAEIIDLFKAKYAINVRELLPNASSSDVVEIMQQTATQPSDQLPDVVDLTHLQAMYAHNRRLFQSYQVQKWSEIPDSMKEPNGHWYCGYYGVIVILVNRDFVRISPSSWLMMSNPEYMGLFAMPGDPRISHQALHVVYAATIERTGGLTDLREGIRYFAQLRNTGVMVDRIGTKSLFLLGESAIVPMWSYLAMQIMTETAGTPAVDMILPNASVAGLNVQAINAYARHPFAARLWQEHLFSDDVQLILARANAIPARFDEMQRSNIISKNLLAQFPNITQLSAVVVPNEQDMLQAKEIIDSQWQSVFEIE